MMKVYLAALAGILSVLLIACGSSDSESKTEKTAEPEAASLSKEEFVARANQYCAQLVKDLDGLEAQMQAAGGSNDYQAIADVYDQLAVRGKEMTADIAALDYEGEDAKTVDSFIDSTRSFFQQTGRLADAMRAEDLTKISGATGDFERANGQASGLAISLGLNKCDFTED